jgi:2-haloacid dehalogenase
MTDPRADRPAALIFDVFGTVVDWRSSVVRELTAFRDARGLAFDATAFADAWRGLYQPSMEAVRAGKRAFTRLDDLHRESLMTLLERHGVTGLAPHEIEHLVTIWHRLIAWPDVAAGLARLHPRFILAPCSNGNIRLMVGIARTNRLPWDAILGAEIAHAFKPQPECYLRSCAALGLAPSRVMMVAAHNGDLDAARGCGLQTAFVARPTEHGPDQTTDLTATSKWTIATTSFTELAHTLDC